MQYWLHRAWAAGLLDIGLSCAPHGGFAAVSSHVSTVNYTFRNRFASNVPAMLEMPPPPYGGPCYAK